MKRSESISNLSKGLIKFHALMGKIVKSETNPFFKSKYAPLPDILQAIASPLQDSGLTFVQMPEGDYLTTVLFHAESGEYLESDYKLSPLKNDPQSVGSSITYARRYALGSILGLNIDEDDDGNKSTQPPQSAPQSTPQSDDNRPWLNDKQFEAIVIRIQNGEKDLIQKTIDNFKVKRDFKTKLDALK